MKIATIINQVFRVKKPKETSKLYLKWLRYLKINKLFDEYMIYVNHRYYGHNTFPNPQDYEGLESLAMALKRCGSIDVGNSYIKVNWYSEFLKFVKVSVPWWNFRIKSKYLWN